MRKVLFKTFVFLVVSVLCSAGANAGSNIRKVIADAEKRGEFSGALLVAKNGKTIFRGAVGMADHEGQVANTAETKFRISSVTKQFTAMLIMQLVEEGHVDLDTAVSEYLPKLRRETFSRITLRHLLQNSSGLPSLDTAEFYASRKAKFRDGGIVIKEFLSGDLMFPPGSRFNYNNGDFIVAGSVIESVTGKSFSENLTSRILVPLQMNDTGLIRSGQTLKGLARGYIYSNGNYLVEQFRNIENYGAAGAMYSTVGDLLKWNRALMDHKLISEKTTEEMFASSEKLGFVALGSWSYPLKMSGKSYRMVERQGAIGGFSALNLFSPDAGISITFLGNLKTNSLFRTYTRQGISFDVLLHAVNSAPEK